MARADMATCSNFINVSSSMYHGYHPHLKKKQSTTVVEPMLCDEIIETGNDIQSMNKKRKNPSTDFNLEYLKRRRQNETVPIVSMQKSPMQMVSPSTVTKTHLDEDLLRETHGCSFYHWVQYNEAF